MVARRQAKQTGVAALLLRRGAAFLYLYATLVISVGVIRGETSIGRYFSLVKSRAILSDAVSALKAENEALAREISMLRESKAYARKILREKYHVTDEGEKIVYYAD